MYFNTLQCHNQIIYSFITENITMPKYFKGNKKNFIIILATTFITLKYSVTFRKPSFCNFPDISLSIGIYKKCMWTSPDELIMKDKGRIYKCRCDLILTNQLNP